MVWSVAVMHFRNLLLFLLLPLILSCCSKPGLSIGSGLSPQYLIMSEEIRQKVHPEFPIEKQIPPMGSARLSNPVVTMAPELNKVRIKTDLNIKGASGLERIPFLQPLSRQTHYGHCQVVCGIRYDRPSRSFYLKDPVLESLSIPTLPSIVTQNSQSILNMIAPQILDQYPVHTLDKSFASRFLKEIKVKSQGVALQFGL